MLLATLAGKTHSAIYVVGNLDQNAVNRIRMYPQVTYIDENEIDLSGRAPQVRWQRKHREWGWYKQMFIRLCIDRFITAEQVVILDSEVFFFDNWDEQRLYTESGAAKCFYWTPALRKPDWDYGMYQGSAYPFRTLRGFEDVMQYANSDGFRRHISGVVLFSTQNVRHIWDVLARETDLEQSFHQLFNEMPLLTFSDHDFYGIAIDYDLCAGVVPTKLVPELLGWYDNHDDVAFQRFAIADPAWSMCQRYMLFPEAEQYLQYMQTVATALQKRLSFEPVPA